jgi:diguanylate cyclase (GGDEF)-like protein
MRTLEPSRPARFAGRALFPALLLSAAVCFAAPEAPNDLLQRADKIRTTNYAQFQSLLQQLDAQADRLSPLQRDWLAYFKGWQSGLQGDYPAAVSALTVVLDRTQDPTLRARARISLLNDQFNAAQYQEAYANLGVLLDSLPKTQDRNAHFLALTVAADLYNEAGQYDLATRYTDQALAYDRSDTSTCYALSSQATTLYKTGKLRTDDAQIRSGLDACQRIGDPIYANVIRLSLAQAQMDHGDVAAALQSLEAHDAEVQVTHSSALISTFRAMLAKCDLLTGDTARASEYARSAIEFANKQVNSKASADAWQVLYEVAKRQDDDKGALAYLEKFAVADKGYLNDTSARALAYQMVRQQVQEKKQQVDALSKQNQVLQLRQEVSKKAAEARDLYLVMLLVVLGSIVFWGWRTKRSEMKFMQISRHDGLTGIFNRHHFVTVAEGVLEQCRNGSQDASVILIDLDHFKSVNDTYGHAVGDTVLKCTVAVCRANLRPHDLLGRLGGEEFGILMPDCVAATAKQVAEQIRLAIANCTDAEEGLDFQISASFGVAGTRMSGYALRDLLIHADGALYQAKREGRNRVIVYDHTKADAKPLPPGVLDRRRG